MNVRAVVVIVFDSVRADHVSAYGYPRETTPTLDSLAARGVLWENLHSASSWTKPSVASIFTGLVPTEHGAFQGVKRGRNHPATTDAIPAGLATLAEAFAGAGWRCGAFMSNAQLGRFTRMDRGFDAYLTTLRKADNVIEAFEDWLCHEPTRPAFAYLHLMETHWPYSPRRRHLALWGGDRDANSFRDYSARDYAALRRALQHQGAVLTDTRLREMLLMYDGAIRRLDGKLRVILESLERMGLRDEAIVVVTADHGEEFLDHRSIGHGHTLYDELTHVPLLIQGPRVPRGLRLSTIRSQVDLGSTLLDLAGISAEFPGRSLLGSAGCESVFSELLAGRRYVQAIHRGEWKLIRQLEFQARESDPLCPTSPRRWAEVVRHRVACELYSSASDPRETIDLSHENSHQSIRLDLTDSLDQWWFSCHPPAEYLPLDLVQIGPEIVYRLRDLGYLE